MTYTDDENYTPPPVAVPHPAMSLDTTVLPWHNKLEIFQQSICISLTTGSLSE